MEGINGRTLTAEDQQVVDNYKARLRAYVLSVLNWRRENAELAKAGDLFKDRFTYPVHSEFRQAEVFRVPGLSARESTELAALNAPFIRDMLDQQHSVMLAGWLARCYELGVVTEADLDGVAALFVGKRPA